MRGFATGKLRRTVRSSSQAATPCRYNKTAVNEDIVIFRALANCKETERKTYLVLEKSPGKFLFKSFKNALEIGIGDCINVRN